MKKQLFTLLLALVTSVCFSQQWVTINNDVPSTIRTQLVASSDNSVTVNLQVPGFYATEVTTPHGEANIISVPKTVSTAAAGEPNLPMIAVPVLIGDRQHYNIRIVDAQYTDFTMEVAPSKGDFPRSINPEDVPYTYGETYSTDAFFPTQNASLYEPYILRDFRGQNMVVYPFAYNPVTHTLRVYNNMTVEMYSDGIDSRNIIDRRSNVVKMDPEISAMYANHFINYGESLSKYTPVDETGELLIICHDAFMTAMQPFVNWKKQIGRPTTMVGTSTAGTTASAIKAYIQNQYNANPDLTHVLLVGDVAQIQGNSYSAGSYGGKSDNMYGQVAGNDLYNDIIIGRFSAENENHVTTQVNKVIHYERDINTTDTWLTVGGGVAAYAGSGGHFGEDDWQHMNNIREDLLGYGYTSVHQDYQSVSGYSSSAAIMSQHYNAGVSIINYCNHGSETSWGVFSYSNSNVNALTNVNKLPIVWSVACLNGKYDYSQPCFGETWLRATSGTVNAPNPTQPTGAIGGMFSYISQPWVPPMYGQDEMVDVLVESYGTNIKRTLGGCSYDGNMKILDQYGQSDNAAKGTYLAWILFGDPTLTLRNAVPANMNVTHASSMSTSATSFTVNATNGNGALATLTRNNEIMGSATINNGTCNITFAAPGTTGTATLTVFGYNKITYVATIEITGGGTQYYNVSVMANPTDGGTVSGDDSYQLGQTCTVTATPNDGYIFVNWMENGNVVSTNPTYTFTVTGNHYLTANFQALPQNYTVSVSANPTNGGTVTGGGTYQEGQSCTVTATAATGYTFLRWTENGSQVSTNASYTFTVTGNRTLVAQFQALPQNYTVSVSANPTNGGTVTGGGTYQEGQSCTVTATAAAGYTFTNWTENGSVVSTQANYTFTVNSNRTLVANFQAQPQNYTISVSANPSNGGTVTGGGSYQHGQSCTVTAIPAAGYTFLRWTENGSQVSTNASYTFNVTGNRTLVAQFQAQSYTVNVSANPTNGGTVTGGGTYQEGQSCTVTATAAAGYTFLRWTENGSQVSTNASYTFNVTGNRTLVAQFQPIPCYAPSNLTATATENNVFLSWQASSTATSYNVYRDGVSIANSITGLTYTDADLEYNHQYCYTVRAICTTGQLSDPTNQACATTENYNCEIPTNVTANVFNDFEIIVNWAATATADSYSIFRNGTQIAWNYPNAGGFVDTDIYGIYGEYCYTIVAECAPGNSEPSEEACAVLTIPCHEPFSFNANYLYEDEDNYGVRLTWMIDGPILPAYFHLYRSTDGVDYELVEDIVPESALLIFAYYDTIGIGSYYYMLTAEYQSEGQTCTSEPVYTSVEVTGIGENSISAKVYPNPAKDEVIIEAKDLSQVRIANIYGQIVYNAETSNDQVRINLSNFARGLYVMHIEANGGQAVKRIVVE